MIPVTTLRPFTRMLMTIGQIPTSYLISMSYEEQLLWFCNFLEKEVIPALNNNAEAVKELQDLFVELKSYVDNYFDNLDIQEEINNKLDEMAESGQLADIIAQYLEVTSVLGFDTKSDLKNADNLINGSITRTLGESTYNDGKGSYYKIRTLTSGDIIDDSNILALVNYPTLIAEKIQNDRLKIYNITPNNTENEILEMINDPQSKILNFKKGNYVFTSPWYLTNNTFIELNNSEIYFNFIGDYDETIGIYGYKLNDTYTGYNGNKISIKNGTIKKGSIALMHNKDSIIENINFIETYCPHVIQLSACKDITIKDCNFNGSKYQSSEELNVSNEIINIDPCTYGAQPYMEENSPMYDNTTNNGIYIKNNVFNSGDLINYQTYICVGSHADINDNITYSDNIIISDNSFNYSYYSALQFTGMNNIKIINNYYNGNNARSRSSFLLTRKHNTNFKLLNNICENICSLIFSGSVIEGMFNENFIINNNIIKSSTQIENYDATIYLGNYKNSVISNNNIVASTTPIRIFSNDISNKSFNNKILNNTLETLTTTPNSIIKCYGDDNTYIIGNNLIGLNNTGYSINFDENSTNYIIQNNKCSDPLLFMHAKYVNQYNSNNNALYQLSDITSSSSINQATPLGTLSNFKGVKLLIGSGNNAQLIELRPFLHNGNFIDSRTMTSPVVNESSSIVPLSFTTDITNNTYSYSANNAPLRKLYGID